MSDFLGNQEFYLNLLDALIDPRVGECRARSAPTKIKFLYHIFQLEKKRNAESWQYICFSKEDLAKQAKISRRHITDFINSPDAELFVDVVRRGRKKGEKKYQSNIYTLKPWLIKIFEFYEKTGIMRGFRDDFSAWKKTYKKRFLKWVIPQIQKGLSLEQILEKKQVMNKLSTVLNAKGSADSGLKGAGIKYIHRPIKHSGYKSKYEQPIPAVQGLLEVGELLRDRFFLQEGDINMLLSRVDLNTHKKACGIGLNWLKNGLNMRSPVRTYQACINKARKALKC